MATRDDLIIATGRSDYPNQVNNVLCFPFIFREALDVRARTINDEMKIAAVHAIKDLAKQPVPNDVLKAYNETTLKFARNYIIPKPLDMRLCANVARAVALATVKSGVSAIGLFCLELFYISLLALWILFIKNDYSWLNLTYCRWWLL